MVSKVLCQHIASEVIILHVYLMCLFIDAGEADDMFHSQSCNIAVRTIDADADVDETAPCINLDSSTLSLVSHLASCRLALL